jgi:hypothetical protein
MFWASVCLGQQQPPGGTNQSDASGYVCVERGPYSKVWQSTLLFTNASGEVETNVQYYTELATGICYLTNSEYVDSVEQVDLAPGGAQAVQGRHQVQWAANANTPGGAVTVMTPDDKQLASTVFGLAYHDVATGSNAIIGQLKDCIGSIVEPNQVLYSNAFSNVTADILFTYTKAGLSQDIVLRQAPLPPDAYGLNDATSTLQVYTEFFTSVQPQVRPMKFAKAETGQRRLKLDYELLSSSANLTLQGDQTYFVTGAVNITGTTTIEGGTVVKYTNSSTAQITATNIVCLTGPYSSGVFTSMNDNSVGDLIFGSTGTPTIGSADYLNYGTLATNSSPLFYYLRFSYANEAITGTISQMGTNSVTIWDCQFLDCGTTFYANVTYGSFERFPINAYNVLYSLCGNVFSNSSSGGNLQIEVCNITADQIGAFEASGSSSCIAENSLFTDVTNRANMSFGNSVTNISGSGIYTNVGAGTISFHAKRTAVLVSEPPRYGRDVHAVFNATGGEQVAQVVVGDSLRAGKLGGSVN